MDWAKLLNTKRVRELFGGQVTARMEGDPRDEFERDYGRAVFSTPVRRLQDKAQVFPLEPLDAVRTRLTHSLEVSSVARGIARGVTKHMVNDERISAEQAAQIETIAATSGLIHDLGNPPFGHAGERAIADWFRNQLASKSSFFDEFSEGQRAGRDTQYALDFLRFEGNPQTIRLVSRLQVLVDEYGLNFTCGTISALCKYLARSHQIDRDRHEKSKLGHFTSENELIERVREETGTGEARNPMTYMVEAADDIVYSAVDLEDGVKKGVLDWAFLKEQLARESNDAKEVKSCLDSATQYVEKESSCWRGRTPDDVYAQAFRTFAIGTIVPSVVEAFMQRYDAIMAGQYSGELVKDCSAAPLIKACKDLGDKYVYCSEPNLRLEVMGRRVVHDLMDIFWEGAREAPLARERQHEFGAKIYALMSPNYRNVFEQVMANRGVGDKDAMPENYCRLQLVTDYVCGMTDTFACTLHKRLTNG